MKHEQKVNVDVLCQTIDRWDEMDRIHASHSRLTRDATRHLHRAEAAWSAVLAVVGRATNAAVLAAAETHPVVWDAVHQIRSSRRS